MMGTMDEYAMAVGHDVFDKTPKAVWAAIAVSLATKGGEQLDDATALVLDEWAVLHANGIIPQKPPRLVG